MNVLPTEPNDRNNIFFRDLTCAIAILTISFFRLKIARKKKLMGTW